MADTKHPGNIPEEGGGIQNAADDAQNFVSNIGAAGQDTAKRFAEEQKAAAAERVEEIASVLDSAAETVERVVPPAAPYVRKAASGARGASSALREQGIGDIIESGIQFARTRPKLLIGGSALSGFMLARFLKSSADRRARARLSSHPLTDAATKLTSSAADMVSDVSDAAGRVMGSGDSRSAASASSTSQAARGVRRNEPQFGGRLNDEISRMGESYPLLLAIVGLAAGAVVGGSLRLTEAEQRAMGPYSEAAKRRVRRAADEQYAQLKEAAERVAADLQNRGAARPETEDQSGDFETVLGGGKPAAQEGKGTTDTAETPASHSAGAAP
ncbi:hypothetical protein [Methylobacterium nigriterrae]|uniref:hypothetical protein n=1 Tax=Methylobacterium nigriterrae TaxID=3127512 RepID=UPI00301417CC